LLVPALHIPLKSFSSVEHVFHPVRWGKGSQPTRNSDEKPTMNTRNPKLLSPSFPAS
jgi:hypothetical protein